MIENKDGLVEVTERQQEDLVNADVEGIWVKNTSSFERKIERASVIRKKKILTARKVWIEITSMKVKVKMKNFF